MQGQKGRADVFVHGLLDNAWRGDDSTGIAVVQHGAERRAADVYKDTLEPFDFIRRPYMVRMLANVEAFSFVLGHTRHSTRGNISVDNAHPFQHGAVTLTHNGTIDNTYDFCSGPDRAGMTVDSEIVTWALSQAKEELNILEQLRGAYAMVWHNAKDGTLNIARNEKKPLHFCYLKDENTLFYASEYTGLMHWLERRNIAVDAEEVLHPAPHVLYKFHLKDLRERTRLPFEPRRSHRHGDVSRSSTGTASDGAAGVPWVGPTSEEQQHIRALIAEGKLSSTVKYDMSVDDQVRMFLKNIKGDNNYKGCGGPMTVAKVMKAQSLLEELGCDFYNTSRMRVKRFQPYRKSNGKFGEISGESVSTGIPMVICNASLETWQRFGAEKIVIVKTINVKKTNEAKHTVVCMEHPTHLRRSLSQFKTKAVLDPEQPGEGRNLYRGPDFQLIEAERYYRLIQDGCVYCGGNINPKFHRQAHWLGVPQRPLCHECAEDDNFWTYFGENFGTDLSKSRKNHTLN